ncbi:hypothetical protein D915_004471 [Fasciola hepatica]|uniref:Uncharacterized protein n=1 Tax=Fasciola hepatica TaxID=6192 RepID=A0A4E0RBD6_FASHE|nr:hypothetical protein D915_004471 [Fasciola hepatica]
MREKTADLDESSFILQLIDYSGKLLTLSSSLIVAVRVQNNIHRIIYATIFHVVAYNHHLGDDVYHGRTEFSTVFNSARDDVWSGVTSSRLCTDSTAQLSRTGLGSSRHIVKIQKSLTDNGDSKSQQLGNSLGFFAFSTGSLLLVLPKR